MNDLISIVMAVKNEEATIQVSIQSILNQTYEHFECIIIDDNSQDNTWDIIQSFHDDRIHLAKNDGTGQTAALNQGIIMAKGHWIARMDGDDWSFPDRLSKQITAAKDGVSLITSDYIVCDEFMRPISEMRLNINKRDQLIKYMNTKNNPICHPLVMFNKSLLLSVGGYDENLKNAQDYMLWKKLMNIGEWIHIPEVVLKYRVRKQSLSIARHPEQERERTHVIKKGPNTADNLLKDTKIFAKKRVVNGLYAYKLGFAAWIGGDRLACWKYVLKSVMNGVRPLRSMGLFLTSFLPREWYLTITGYKNIYL